MKTAATKESLRKIRLHGKYLEPIAKFVANLDFQSKSLFRFDDDWELVVETLANLHREFLSPDDVASALVDLCIEYRFRHPMSDESHAHVSDASYKEGLVNEIKSYFESIPRQYCLRVKLSSFPSLGAQRIDFSHDARLISVADTSALPARLGKGYEFSFPAPGDIYLEFDSIGYADESIRSPAASACVSLAKQFLFVAQTTASCSHRYAPELVVASFNGGRDSSVFSSITLPERVGQDLARLEPRREKLRVYDSRLGLPNNFTLLTDPGREPENQDELATAIRSLVAPISKFFKARVNPDFESIAAAVEWYQDSLSAENDTFAYIAACVGLEAVLGSASNVDSLSKRLTDRYAFMIGTSRRNREQLIENYKKILDLRGQLVHAKAARLPLENRYLLREARLMLFKVIWHELNRIYVEEGI